jgi:ribosomal protein S18 acetylase RimI-like enzyme
LITIRTAATSDADDVVALEVRLFAEDAGRYECFADITWPAREGRADFERLIADGGCVVLVACEGQRVIGYLDGYLSPPSPTRQPVSFAVLRSLYVDDAVRRTGAARALVERFVAWAEDHGCVEVHVDHYAANDPASKLYEDLEFRVRSVTRVMEVGRD